MNPGGQGRTKEGQAAEDAGRTTKTVPATREGRIDRGGTANPGGTPKKSKTVPKRETTPSTPKATKEQKLENPNASSMPDKSGRKKGKTFPTNMTKLDPAKRAKQMTDNMKNVLKLDDVQTQKVSDLNLKTAQKINKVMTSGKKEGVIERQVQKIKTKRDASIKKLLNADQMTKFLELNKKMEDRSN